MKQIIPTFCEHHAIARTFAISAWFANNTKPNDGLARTRKLRSTPQSCCCCYSELNHGCTLLLCVRICAHCLSHFQKTMSCNRQFPPHSWRAGMQARFARNSKSTHGLAPSSTVAAELEREWSGYDFPERGYQSEVLGETQLQQVIFYPTNTSLCLCHAVSSWLP